MHSRHTLALGNFFFNTAINLADYTLFTYLTAFMTKVSIGFALAGGGVVALVLFYFLPRLTAHCGARRLALGFGAAQVLMLLLVALLPNTYLGAALVILVISSQPLLYYGLDLLLEATVSDEGTTGRVRTFFLTGGNLGALVAPLIIGALLFHADNYSYVFYAAAVSMALFFTLIAARPLSCGEKPSPADLRETLRYVLHDRDLAAVTVGHLLLYLFYIWAPFYVPVFLHSVLGLPWSELGWMFAVMLVPYILIEYPAGWAADRFLGDKKLMLLGFVVMGLSLAAIGVITHETAPLIILAILFATRVGAALVESMTEGHFFRRVSEKDVVSVSIFRGVWPVANIIAPLLGSAVLIFGGYSLFFVIIGIFILLVGTAATLSIHDFR